MDWRTSDEQPDTQFLRTPETGPLRAGSLAGAADAPCRADGFGRVALEPALVRELQVARTAGRRFGGGNRVGVSE
jgi:hypothetical protein